MSASQTMTTIQRLRSRILLQGGAALTDADLLDRFVQQHDPAAITALVHRHGPTVWGVCRRMLSNHHDAEDAFQATFVVLMRRADSVQPRAMVGPWLY